MRSDSLALPLLAIAALGLLAAPVVLADGEGHGAADDGRAKAAEKRANATQTRDAHANANASDDNGTDERGASRGRSNETHGRPAHVTTFVERMQSLRLAWHENATKVREGCRAEALDHANATGNETRAYAHCIRDGYKDLRAWLLDEITAAREDFRAAQATWKAEQRAAQAREHARDA